MKQIKPQLFLVLMMALYALPVTAYDFEVDGIYYLKNGSNAIVTYQSYPNSTYPSSTYSSDYTGDVVIPSTVTYNGTTYSVTSIGTWAFCGCSGLTSINIPNSITAIGVFAFLKCSGLINITIPKSVTTIGGGAFTYCSSLSSVTAESGNPNYDSRNNCNAIIETATNTLIVGCKNTIIPNSVITIGEDAFSGRSGLTSINIPNSVTTIGSNAFSFCSGLTSINIPNSVTTIGGGAFSETAWFNNQPQGLVYAGLVAYKYKGSMPEGTTIALNDGTLGIAQQAFYGCNGLTSISIPSSVTEIGHEAFAGCSGLSSIIVKSGNPIYDSRNNCNAIIETASNTLIAGCKNTTIPNSVTTIGNKAFEFCSGLTSINIPNSVTIIESAAFNGCSGLTSVTIGNSVTEIRSVAFSYCTGLTSVTCMATTPPANSGAFLSDVTNQATLYVPMKSVSSYQTANNWKDFSHIIGIITIDDFEADGVWYRVLSENTAMVISRPDEDELYNGDVVIPEEVAYEDYTFSVVGIEEGAFEDCYDLNSVVIGDAVETVGETAFQGCTGLTSVTIGSGVTSIGAKAFNYCNALQTVTCRGTVPPVMASSNCFSTAAYNRAKLVVPRPEIETYSATDYWYKFSHIEGWGYLGPGDVNGSGTIDMDDLTRLINIMLTDDLDGIDPSWADVTGNGIVSMNDLTELINLLLTQ